MTVNKNMNSNLLAYAPASKVSTAQQFLSDAEEERSYTDRLRFYRELAYLFAETDPNATLKLSKITLKRLGWL